MKIPKEQSVIVSTFNPRIRLAEAGAEAEGRGRGGISLGVPGQHGYTEKSCLEKTKIKK